MRRTLSASLDRDAFRLFPHPYPSPTGRGRGGHLHKYIKSMSGDIPCYKKFAALILSLVTPPRPSPQGEEVARLPCF